MKGRIIPVVFINSFFNSHNKTTEEGRIREALAAFFLSVPPHEKQSAMQQVQYRRALRCMAEIETYSLLQSATVKRPLRYGDVNALLGETLKACFVLLKEKELSYKFVVPQKSVCTAAEPRVITGAVVRLLYATAVANRGGSIFATVRHRENSISITIGGDNAVCDTTSLRLAKAASCLHKGTFAVSSGTAAFSLRLGLPGAVGLFSVQPACEILNNPLSAVNLAFQ